MRMLIGFLLLFYLVLLSMTASMGADRPGCQVCGMYIDQYQRTAGELEYSDGKVIQSCGLACLLRLVEDAGGPDAFTALSVKDWVSGEKIQAREALYVLSSSVVPDMLPNIIAFRDRTEAENFRQQNGGEVITFSQALLVISPTAMTMPARIKTAALPASGATGIGFGVMTMQMDKVVIGTDSIDPGDFVRRPGQKMGPKKMESTATMLMANYGITDRLALDGRLAYLDKSMEMYTMSGMATRKTDNDGISDLLVSLRYNFYKSISYKHFATVLVQTSLPTGNFEKEFLAQPGLQNGTGDFTFGGGLLYTYRYNNIWLHTMAAYTHKLENSDNFTFGDEGKVGLALHYTPNYDLMFGLEADLTDYSRNEINGNDIGNSGGTRSMLTGVASWRFLTALGGNFNLRLTAGLPIYEDLNSGRSMGMETVQMGGGWFGSISISFNRRFASQH